MRVLFLTHRLPYAPNRGDRIRAFHILRTLAPHADVDLFSFVHDAEEASHVEDLRGQAASVTVARVRTVRNVFCGLPALASGRALTHVLLDASEAHATLSDLVRTRRSDVILAFCSGMARFALEPPLSELPFVLDLVDVDSQKWASLGAGVRPPRSWIFRRESRALARFESYAAARAFSTLVVNRREADLLASIAPGTRIDIVPNGIDADPLRPAGDPVEGANVVFCGVMNYEPNEQAAIWFAEDVWPLVRTRHPAARLSLVGAQPTRAVRRLSESDSSIEVTGSVPDVRPYLWSAAVSVAPLQLSRGVQNKVLEAVAAGLPVVVTPSVAEGLPPEVMSACLVAGSPGAFAEAIGGLLDMRAADRRALARSADLCPLEWTDRLAPLINILHDAAAARV